MQAEIIKSFRNYDVVTATLILKHTLKPLYRDTARFSEFERDIQQLRATILVEGAETTATAKDMNFGIDGIGERVVGQEVERFDVKQDLIVAEFNGPGRLKYSDELIRRFPHAPPELVSVLVNSLLQPDDPRSYRINLYIALTLGRFPYGWPRSADPERKIEALKKTRNYKRDRTFEKRVEEAISNGI